MQPVPPCPDPARWWQTWSSRLLLLWEFQLGAYSVFVFVFLPVMLPSEIPKLPHRPTSERVSCCLETSPPSRLPPWDGSLSLTLLSLFFAFYILSYLLLKKMGCLSGCLMTSVSIQKLFCGSCSAFKWSFNEFVGGKWSPHLIPPPSWDHPVQKLSIVCLLPLVGDLNLTWTLP